MREKNGNNKKIDKKVYVLSLAITISIILIVFSFNWYLNSIKAKEIEENLSDLQLIMQESQLELLYITSYTRGGCSFLESGVKTISEELVENNKKLKRFESNTIDDAEYKKLKAEHTIIFAKLWMLNMRIKEECDSNTSTILYFFDIHSDESGQQGYVLDSIYNKYSENVFIFPMDANFDLGIIKILRDEYNITTTPTIVVNEKEKFEGLTHKNEIEEVLFEKVANETLNETNITA